LETVLFGLESTIAAVSVVLIGITVSVLVVVVLKAQGIGGHARVWGKAGFLSVSRVLILLGF
jgi:hypothetical protein